MKVLEASNLSHSYPRGRCLFRGVNLSLSTGEIVSLTGASGCGKTTLLLILAGAIKPSSGTVKIHCPRNRLGFLYQDPHLMDSFSLVENVEISGKINGVNDPRARAWGLLRKLSLEDVGNSEVASLSAGERQRAALAQVMMNSPQLILADEITGNLDGGNAEQVLSLLEEMKEQAGILLVTHDKALAARGDKTLTLSNGTFKK